MGASADRYDHLVMLERAQLGGPVRPEVDPAGLEGLLRAVGLDPHFARLLAAEALARSNVAPAGLRSMVTRGSDAIEALVVAEASLAKVGAARFEGREGNAAVAASARSNAERVCAKLHDRVRATPLRAPAFRRYREGDVEFRRVSTPFAGPSASANGAATANVKGKVTAREVLFVKKVTPSGRAGTWSSAHNTHPTGR